MFYFCKGRISKVLKAQVMYMYRPIYCRTKCNIKKFIHNESVLHISVLIGVYYFMLLVMFYIVGIVPLILLLA